MQNDHLKHPEATTYLQMSTEQWYGISHTFYKIAVLKLIQSVYDFYSA